MKFFEDEKKMKTLFFALTLFFGIAALNANESIRSKIDSLLENRVIEMSSEELNVFLNKDFEQKVISKLNKENPDKIWAKAISDYIEIKNYEIINAINLSKNFLFFNYLIRSNEGISPESEDSKKALGHDKIKHHLIFIYDKNKKEIAQLQYLFVQYTPITFHKYEYKRKNVLYAIANNSSSGMAVTDIYLVAFSTKNLELLFSECVLFSKSFYSGDIEDVKFEKDFVFDKNKIKFSGKDFDFKVQKYLDYNKTYPLF